MGVRIACEPVRSRNGDAPSVRFPWLVLALAAPFCFASCGLVMGDIPPDTQAVRFDAGGDSASGGTTGWDGASDAPVDSDADADTEEDAGRCDSGAPAQAYYRDADGDGYGNSGQRIFACTPPGDGWTLMGDDCHDGEKDVHPGQTHYFATGYWRPGEQDSLSFDYDCDRQERGAPEQVIAPADCTSMILILCGGSGFEKNDSRPEGARINPYCGSNVMTTCNGLAGACQAQTKTVLARFLCN